MATTEIAQHGRTFTPEESARGGRNAAINYRAQLAQQAERRAVIDRITQAWETGDIGTTALASAQELLARLMDGLDAVELKGSMDVERYVRAVDALFKIHRLATGQSTSNSAVAHVDRADLEAQRAALLEQLRPLGEAGPAQ